MKKSSDTRSRRRTLREAEAKLETSSHNITYLAQWLDALIDYLRFVSDDKRDEAAARLNAWESTYLTHRELFRYVIIFTIIVGEVTLFSKAWNAYLKQDTHALKQKRTQQQIIKSINESTKAPAKVEMLAILSETVFNQAEVEVKPTNDKDSNLVEDGPLVKLKAALKSEQIDNALVIFETLKLNDSKQHKVAHQLAIALLEKKLFKAALEVIDYALAKKPKAQPYLETKAAILKLVDEPQSLIFIEEKNLVRSLEAPFEQLKVTPKVVIEINKPLAIIKPELEVKVVAKTVKIKPAVLVDALAAPTKKMVRLSKIDAHTQRSLELQRQLSEGDLKSYLPLAQSFMTVNYLASTHKLVDQTAINLLQAQAALDLKTLDMQIRQLVLPHVINIEFNFRTLYAAHVGPNDQNSKVFTKISQIVSEEFRVIFDDARITNSALTKSLSVKHFRTFLMFMFLQLRNFLMHGGRNLFSHVINNRARLEMLKLYSEQQTFNYALSEDANETWRHLGDVYDEDIFSESAEEFLLRQNVQSASRDVFELFYDLEILRDLMPDSARKGKKLFGVLIFYLFLANDSTHFISLVSSIEQLIEAYLSRHQVEFKTDLYAALGLNSDWLKRLLKRV